MSPAPRRKQEIYCVCARPSAGCRPSGARISVPAMVLRLCCAAVAAVLLACGPSSTHRPDGGGVVLCTPDEETFLAVLVQNQAGEPVDAATVVARNVGTNQRVTGSTDRNGLSTAVGSSIGSGSIEVSATKATRVSETKQVEFVCGECGCDITPPSVTLQIAL